MIYPIVLFGDPVLKKKAAPVPQGEDLTEFIQSMYETMYAASGVGLAAPQIGQSIRVFIIDSSPMEDKNNPGVKAAFINPKIIDSQGEPWAFEEGCLSIPGIREDVKREPKITIRYFDQEWNEHTQEYDGIVARIIQHEYDHIEGILFTDHITPFKKRLLKSKLNNISKGKVDIDYRVKVP